MKNRRLGRINVKAVIILVSVLFVLGAGAVIGRYARKRIISARSLAAGRAALLAEDWPTAVRQLRNYLERNPEDQEMLEAFARAHLSIRPAEVRNLVAAIDAYRRLLRIHPGDAGFSKELVRLYFRIGESADAAYVCRQRLEADPRDAAMRLWLARALIEQQQAREAGELLKELVADDPTKVKAFAMLSALALQEDPDRGVEIAARWLDQAVEANPSSVEARVVRARFRRLIQKAPDAARQDLGIISGADVGDPATALALVEEWIALGDVAAAEKMLRDLESLDPELLEQNDLDPEAFAAAKYLTLARLALQRGDASECAALADRALGELSKGVRDGFLSVAVDLYLTGGRTTDARQSLEQFQTALEKVGPSQGEARERLVVLDAAVAEAEGRPYRVIELLSDYREQPSDAARALWLLFRAYERTGQNRLARQTLERYVGLRPDDVPAAIALARFYKSEGRWTDCLTQVGRAENISPDPLEVKLLRIEAMLQGAAGAIQEQELSRWGTQLTELRSAHPRDSRIRVLQAALAERTGKPDQARGELQQAAQECDAAWNSVARLAGMLIRAARFDEAVALLREHVRRSPKALEPRLALVECLRRAKRPDDVETELRAALPEFHGDDHARLLLGFAGFLLADGKSNDAMVMLRDLASDRPNDAAPRLALLSIPQVQSDSAASQLLVDELKGIEGESGVRWRLEQARLWLRHDDWRRRRAEIEALLTWCLGRDPEWSAPALALGELYERAGEDEQAEQLYRQSFESHRRLIDVGVRLAVLLDRQRRHAEALEVLDRLPMDVSALVPPRVGAALGQGDIASAAKTLERQVLADENDAGSRVLLARLVFVHKKDFDAAARLLDEAEEIAPDRLAVVIARAQLFHDAGRDEDAIALCGRVVEERRDFDAHYLVGSFLASIGRFELAEQHFRLLPELDDRRAEGYAALGRFYHRMGRAEDAIAAFSTALETKSDNPSLQRMLVVALSSRADQISRDRARTILKELVRNRPDDPDLLAAEATLLLAEYSSEATDEAAKLLERVVQLDPRNTAAHLQRIELARRRGDLNTASRLALQAVGANRGNTPLMLARAGLEAEMGNSALARQFAEEILRLDSKNVGARNLMTDLALRAGDFPSARVLNEQARGIEPDNEFAQVLGAKVLEGTGSREEAIVMLEGFIAAESGRRSVTARMALAEICRKGGDFDRSGRALDEASQLPADPVAIAIERMLWLAAQQRYADVRNMLAYSETAAPLDPRAVAIGARILASSEVKENLSFAQSLFERMLAGEPERLDALLGLAQVAYRMGDLDAAERAYRRVLSVDPYHRQALNDLAWIVGVAGNKTEEAIELADRGVDRFPGDPHLLDTRGALFAKLQRWNEARRDFEACLTSPAIVPTTRAKANLRLARVYLRLSEPRAAAESLAKAETVDREHQVLSGAERKELDELKSQTTR